jgi:hypothetical protein
VLHFQNPEHCLPIVCCLPIVQSNYSLTLRKTDTLFFISQNMIDYHGDDAETDARRSTYEKTTEVVDKKNLRKGGGNLVLGSDDEDSDFD